MLRERPSFAVAIRDFFFPRRERQGLIWGKTSVLHSILICAYQRNPSSKICSYTVNPLIRLLNNSSSSDETNACAASFDNTGSERRHLLLVAQAAPFLQTPGISSAIGCLRYIDEGSAVHLTFRLELALAQ